jgi:catechol 2,3-dioxygenase-like lactoylglutathione lyase family enzyme
MKLTEIAYFSENVAEMATFYRSLLGSNPVAESADMAIFMVGHTKIFIHRTYEQGEGDLPPENHQAFTVEDVDASCRALTEQGLTIEVAPNDYYWGRSAYLRDPDGHMIELNQPDGGS